MTQKPGMYHDGKELAAGLLNLLFALFVFVAAVVLFGCGVLAVVRMIAAGDPWITVVLRLLLFVTLAYLGVLLIKGSGELPRGEKILDVAVGVSVIVGGLLCLLH